MRRAAWFAVAALAILLIAPAAGAALQPVSGTRAPASSWNVERRIPPVTPTDSAFAGASVTPAQTSVDQSGPPSMGFRYSAILLLPLVLLLGVLFAVRTLTSDATPTTPTRRPTRPRPPTRPNPTSNTGPRIRPGKDDRD